ncbi:bifunctional sterol desaturase/short chain dehydrogenase [Aetokthonos hydrillicola Thurmond2011]|uniref:Bifunctional sterol desaturase/short chain dehydrogenase n=1 Tax=Aetokthonos hydrillicola Thurmond2011 TaxID=2712845 RepID=A0AAP5I3P0_9CYAN|nr:bifunctional sterol desaturase/short chain dehydrogenase [Aetokthonos hydrillicola]MBO3462198.1 bifunctional sterol desaturase/short chain dehydrogenase [Aetokthonos hydrillicola CCALA 1050]MBW4585104.1 bifunctional sterol desaturase/short chain dehydrogenase [Aetokthonos hydrillicola CCALA 1050]MDR9894136.1 bifunctional sterol desaturase/short chain dehydrogenase [Aetokthonos hydrillicola Thurmond2011]
MISFCILAIIWGLGSIVWVELVRDLYHVLAHISPFLYRQHVWHHRVFSRDFTFANATTYRQAQWRNDLPECLVMMLFTLVPWWVSCQWTPVYKWATLSGSLYTLVFLVSCVARGSGSEWAQKTTDATHRPGAFMSPPGDWFVNRPYHWRHHFDDDHAYYCSTFTVLDKLMGTALSFKGKTVAVTGASGTLGRSLLLHLHQGGAKVMALTSKSESVTLTINDEPLAVKTITWQTGCEAQLAEQLKKVDILVINHGINVRGERTSEAVSQSYEVNTFSAWRLMEIFLSTVRTNEDMALKEVWINTSEAEVNPAFSPLYELSKRTLGDLVTLRRLDAPCIVRKLILGPFKSSLNPIGVMSSDWVARQIVALARRDARNIIVTINPLTYLLFPVKEFFVAMYFKFFTHPARDV